MPPSNLASRSSNACPECFAHPWLREFVSDHGTHQGTCPNCRRRNQPLLPVLRLHRPFENLLSAYHRSEGPPLEAGNPIIELVQADWNVFSERLIKREGERELFDAIMLSGWDDDSGEARVIATDDYALHSWSHQSL